MNQSTIQATANSDHIEYGTALIRTFTPQVVMAKVVQKLLMFWGAALFSVFLPVVHFVLVPLFFILGIFFAYRARNIKYEISLGEIHCPRCHSLVKIDKADFINSHKEICQSCACVLKIWPT